MNCTGCGAFSQIDDPNHFGYYDVKSKRVRKWMHPDSEKSYEPLLEVSKEEEENQLVDEVLKNLDASELEALGLDAASLITGESNSEQDMTAVRELVEEKPPVCERCHGLMHHGLNNSSTQISMHHPTVEALRETIEESPHKHNHIYHIIDAADFPMSLIPRLHVLLGDIPLRSRNRRSKATRYVRDRQIEMSFIITRGDLLGPTKKIVDGMMPYLRDVMRDALGRIGPRIRLGNLRCVSAKRAWWTSDIREEIWKRGGAGWLVGKVNVGKSQLFEAVYPKGRLSGAPKSIAGDKDMSLPVYPRNELAIGDHANDEELEIGELLPPAQPATQYPDMPIVSSLPGTTASPIRIPFGNKKGELIDLPGLERSDLELFVKPEHRQSMIMKSRIVPEQISAQSTESLLLGGGLIRITPRTPDLTFLLYNFTPLDDHITNTTKAIEFQGQQRMSPGVKNISIDGIGDRMAHAGTFKLKHDVTKLRAGPLTRKNAVGLSLDRLPFRVFSIDLLIEGVGYVEVVAQMRTRDLKLIKREKAPEPVEEETPPVPSDPFDAMKSERRETRETLREIARFSKPAKPEKPVKVAEPEYTWPEIDVFSPEGRFIGSRRPIQGWLHNKPLVKPENKRARPRRSMTGQKKKEKHEMRAVQASS